jgi:Phage XkdN-like protein.
MNNLSAFLAKNVKPVGTVKYVATERITDENGNPVEWELRCVDSETDESIRTQCMKKVPIPGKKNQYTQELDSNLYLRKTAVACILYPDLYNAELQDSYGVKDPEKLLLKILSKAGEYHALIAKINELNGQDTIDDLVDEAKN